MRKSTALKALALILAALSFVLAFTFFWACTFLLNAGLYHGDSAALLERVQNYRAESLACNLANRYATKTQSAVSQSILSIVGQDYDDELLSDRANLENGSWFYTICDQQGHTLEENRPADVSKMTAVTVKTTGRYLVQSDEYCDVSCIVNNQWYYFDYADSEEYTVTVYLQNTAITAIYGLPLSTIDLLYQHRYAVIAYLGLSLLLCGLCLVYLCMAAGHSKKYDHIHPGGLNRLPLDIYGVAAVFVIFALLDIVFDSIYADLFSYPGNVVATENILFAIAAGVCFLAIGLLATGFIFALAAQLKAPDRFWLKNTLIYRVALLLWNILRKAFRFGIKLLNMLPLMVQWLLGGITVLLLPFFSIWAQSEFLLILSLLVDAAIIVYCAFAYGTLLRGAIQMAQGDLHGKISSKYLFGTFRDFSTHLNQLSDVTVAAADAHLRSERMKTELITNVSHDIKTPLTSIINYTDLLRTAPDEQTREEYLQILENQGLRLKRLIEDLTDLSRASSGNIQADIKPMDAEEALRQALGEFSDKLSAAQLQVCTRFPDKPVRIAADGRLFWRVASNLIGNVVKYAQPGTRVYVELTAGESTARISVKNISREPLNIRAEELTERFVRGDQSRNTEGSGLGLSIASSLMEVQKGRLAVRIDADLFTAELTFLKAEL